MARARTSAGILLYRRKSGALEVLLVHPGGPFWKNRDDGAWSIPKGEVDAGEDLLAAARRELTEETGVVAEGELIALTPVRQRAGKLVHAWAAVGDCEANAVSSNVFSMEWPPRSGVMREFPEVDRAAWYTLDAARVKILPAQQPLLDELGRLLPAAS
jgi:predicted NUDIX family NTP pyrophosphohydrolase